MHASGHMLDYLIVAVLINLEAEATVGQEKNIWRSTREMDSRLQTALFDGDLTSPAKMKHLLLLHEDACKLRKRGRSF
jgi:hypothetical protein